MAALLWREDPFLLPASRAEFYRRAVIDLWKRKVPVSMRDRTGDRDRLLEMLARRMVLNPEASKRALEDAASEVAHADAATLLDGLRASGVLRIDDERETVSFLHLTFQEYYLSAALMRNGSSAAVERHWEHPRYDEVLALLLARLTAGGRPDEAREGLARLIELSRLYSKSRQLRCRAERSPLRVALHLVARSGLPIEIQRQLWPRFNEEIGQGTRILAAAADPFMPPAVLEWLAGDSRTKARWWAAGNSSMPAAALERLAGDPDDWVRQVAAGNPSIPAVALERLAGDPDADVRRRAAGNPSMPAAMLEHLAGDPDVKVQREAAGNPSMPAAMLERLAGDPDADVRQVAAGNPSIPAVALECLAGDPDDWVRRGAAGNPSLPAVALECLAGDPDDWVRRRAAENPSMPAVALECLAGDPDAWGWEWVARNPSMPAAALEQLVRDPKAHKRTCAALNPSMPAAALERLACDPNADVRIAVIRNPNTLLESLPKRPSAFWRLWRWLQR